MNRVSGLFRCPALFSDHVRAVGIAGGGFDAEVREGGDALAAEIGAQHDEATFLEPGEEAPGAA